METEYLCQFDPYFSEVSSSSNGPLKSKHHATLSQKGH